MNKEECVKQDKCEAKSRKKEAYVRNGGKKGNHRLFVLCSQHCLLYLTVTLQARLMANTTSPVPITDPGTMCSPGRAGELFRSLACWILLGVLHRLRTNSTEAASVYRFGMENEKDETVGR